MPLAFHLDAAADDVHSARVDGMTDIQARIYVLGYYSDLIGCQYSLSADRKTEWVAAVAERIDQELAKLRT